MTNIIDMNTRLKQANQPDDDQVFFDDDGQTWFHYTCSYQVGDKEFCLDLWALSYDDALCHIDAIKKTIKFDGQLYAEIDDN